ncbi:hypothetical protein [Bacillus infantis]|uniref:hypothetical protein n=1 Tax=Bacillus infantis TaxID=324767 RepID=UPI00209EF6C3|nr:hypothetical protein [Bacillus infantis]MCP1156772.1 hypothetical protein [Bacillus infantis]
MNLILLIKEDKNKEQASKIRKAEGLGGKKLLGKAACRPAAAYNSFMYPSSLLLIQAAAPIEAKELGEKSSWYDKLLR